MSTTSNYLNAIKLSNNRKLSIISASSQLHNLSSSVQSVEAKEDKFQPKKLSQRKFAIVRGSSRHSHSQNQKKRRSIMFDPADELLAQREMLARSAHYQSWRSVCKSSYHTYMKLYKYILMRSASSLQLLEQSLSISASESIATSTMASTTTGASMGASSTENSTSFGSSSSITEKPTATEAEINKEAAT